MTQRAAVRGPLLVLAAATLWGSVGTAQELGPTEAWPPAVAAFRSLAGGALLVAVVVARQGFGSLAAGARAAPAPLALAGAAIAAFQWGYFSGIRLTGVAVGTLLAIGSAPVWAGVIEAVRHGRPSPRWIIATAVTVTGTALLTLGGGDAGDGVDPVGVAASLSAGAAYALYTAASSRLVGRGVTGARGMALTFTISGLLLVPALLPRPIAWAWTAEGMVMTAWLAVAATAVAYTLFAAGLRTVDAPTATTLTLAEPLTATLLAIVVVGERLPPLAAAGAASVGVGLLLAGRRPRPTALATTPPGQDGDGR
ncbi:MAG TPA: DMT family transporter [Egicoccus sp.]|nr:DMT family transporter [Egicoccus sp.]HSK22309.1 DMT family transporter [Egicoccus sp.]